VIAPSWLAFDVLGVSLFATAAVLVGVNGAARRARWADRDRGSTVQVATVLLATWFVLALVLAVTGFYRTREVDLPRLPLALLPAALGGVFLWRSNAIAPLLAAAPQGWLVGVQGYRVVGVSFLVLWATGYLPAVFAVPAGLGDVAVGVMALVLLRFARARRPRLVGVWNLLGLVDFVVAFTTGFLSVPTPLRPVPADASSILITMFPLVMIPTYLVPLSILLHVASLRKLARERSASRASGAGSPAVA
jgi:hypothetical protein